MESLHHQLNGAFQFPYQWGMFKKPIENQVRYTLKFMRFESIDYINEEHIRRCIKCQSFFRGRSKYGWCVILEGFTEDEYVKQICPTQKVQN